MTEKPQAQDTAKAPEKRRKATRTADGEGGIYFDKKRKLWIGELMVGWKPDAKDPKKRRRDARKVSARRQAECRAKLQRLRQDVTAGMLPGQSKATLWRATSHGGSKRRKEPCGAGRTTDTGRS